MQIGFISGVFDLFHIGHLNLLKNAKGLCDKLIVGVFRDDSIVHKDKKAIIPFKERIEIVRSVKFVDTAIPQEDEDKFALWQKLKFDTIFVGDDWFKSDRWEQAEKQLKEVGVKIIYFPYTKGTSSTLLSEALIKLRDRV